MWQASLRYSMFLVIFGASSIFGGPIEKFREDYIFNPKNNAFYKLHTESVGYDEAKSVCKVEGATLTVVTSIYDTIFVHGLLKEYPDIGNFVWIGDDGDVHEIADDPSINFPDYTDNEQPTYDCSVLNREGIIQKHVCKTDYAATKLPFVCKVTSKEAPYDKTCKVYATGYVNIPNVGSCYKIPRIVYTWNHAYAECRAEGAHLVVINSEAERAAVQNLMTTTEYLETSHSKYYYLAGIRAQKSAANQSRSFRTVFNQTLEEAGFAEWADTEPNNFNNNENCGSLYESDGKYNDQNCDDVYGFICEKETGLV